MRIIFIRHGDPNYVQDKLTEKGKREAALLGENVNYLELGKSDFYVSPLGRAQETAKIMLKNSSKPIVIKEWLREIPAVVYINEVPELLAAYPDAKKKGDRYLSHLAWDMVPAYWTEQEDLMDNTKWKSSEVVKHSNILEVYEHVIKEFDALLATYGYVREGCYYRVERESDSTIVCVCHMGIIGALLSHLWSISPFIMWHSLCLAPTSVSELVSEERQQGVAYFRATRLGDIAHLRIGGEEPSFSGRFCEVFSNQEQRH